MNEEIFWQIVQRAHDKSSADMDKKSRLIKNEIKKLSKDEARQFSIIFDKKMDEAYSWSLWDAANVIVGGCSDDAFTDFRSSLISRGKSAFQTALLNPDSLAEQEFDEYLWFYEGYQYAITDGVVAVLGEVPERLNPHPDSPSGNQCSVDELDKLYPRITEKFS